MFRIFFKSTLSLCAVGVALVTLSKGSQAVSLVGTEANINVLTGSNPDSASGIAPSATSQADFKDSFGAIGTAFAKATGTTLRATTTSEGVGFVNGSFASSGLRNSYTILGNPNNVGLPLTFNFDLTGKISQETPGFSAAISSFSYDITNYGDSVSQIGGGVTLTTQAGAVVFFSENNVGVNPKDPLGDRLRVTLTPTVTFLSKNLDLKKFLPEELKQLGIPADILGISSKELVKAKEKGNAIEPFDYRKGYIAAALNKVPAFKGLPVGLDIEYVFDSRISTTQTVTRGGELDAFLQAQADANRDGINGRAKAETDFGNTLKLASITVPQDFNAVDVGGLKVSFDSGDIFSVTQELRGLQENNLPIKLGQS